MFFFWSKLFPRYEDRMAAMSRASIRATAFRAAELLELEPME